MLMMMLVEQNQPFIKDCCMTRQLKLVEQSTLHTVKLSDELYFFNKFYLCVQSIKFVKFFFREDF